MPHPIVCLSALFSILFPLCLSTQADDDILRLRAFAVPNKFKFSAVDDADRRVIEAFRKHHPDIELVGIQGLQIGSGDRQMDMVPFMQIAGNIAPDVLGVNFRQSQTYIDMKLLYPLDRYVERLDGVTLPDSSSLENEAYIAELKKGANWKVIEDRVIKQCWPVIRRACPYGVDCPYRHEQGLAPLANHRHIWCFPIGPIVMGLEYDRPMFAEHAAEGVEQRAPRDWEEMLRWCTVMTNPAKGEYGLKNQIGEPAWEFLSFLYSAGGRVVEEDKAGNWHCTLDTEEAVEAAWFYARLRWQKIVRDGQEYRGVMVSVTEAQGPVRYAMSWEYLDDRFMQAAVDQTKGVGPVPAGPTGKRGSEFNSRMCGIFAGLKNDDRRRNAAWDWIEFFDGDEARRIRTEKLVEAGLGPFVRQRLLERYNDHGRYNAVLRQHSPEMEETYRLAYDGGVPEPYGKNCQSIYNEMNKPLGAIFGSSIVRDAVDNNDPVRGKAEIRGILKRATARINEKMLGILPPAEVRTHNTLAWLVIAVVVAVFTLIFRKVFKVFTPKDSARRGQWQFRRYSTAYLLMLPALASIALWMYWPMLRGMVIAFQDYSVLGDSRFVGSENFANVLYSSEFWYSLRVSLVYAMLYLLFGFWVPIALALLLQEVPRGKTFFRTIYYLPAVLSGAVVVFLWQSFYNPDGLVNQIFGPLITAVNHVLPSSWRIDAHQEWLSNPSAALFCVLLPTIWAGMGPGCLIYLAALKTVPDQIYEAADIDGAGLVRKVFNVALPSIRALIGINFIGAMIGAVRGASAFVLAMTAGGPFSEHGGATEVVGLKIFYTTFGYLQFGAGAAMAWILGSLLIGFTVLQLQRLSKLEFRTSEKVT